MDPDLIEVLSLANALSSHAGLTVRIASIRHCNALFYSQLLARLMDIELSPLSTEEARCQAVVDALSNHLSPQISLDHIKGADLANGDLLTVKNLLDIFSVLLCLPPTPHPHTPHLHTSDTDDSNVITSEGMSVISELLRDELGKTTDTDSTTELLRPVPRAPIYTTPVAPRATTPDRPISLQTTPTHSPRRRRSVMSPLHHSTPHVSTRSRATHPLTPPTLAYENNPPHVVRITRANSAPSSPIPDLTIMELHTTNDTPPREPANQSNSTIEQAVRTPLPPSDVDSAPPSGPDDTLDHSQQQMDSRGDVLATLYKNYVTGLGSKVNRRGSKGRRQRSVRKKNNKRVTYATQRETTPLSSDDEATHRTLFPKEFAVGDDLMPLVEGDFPFLQLSPSMMRVLWSRQMAQIRALTAQGVASRSRGVCNRVSEIERRQQALLGIINKEVQHTKRMAKVKEVRCEKRAVATSMARRRENTARARRYFVDYELQLKAKLQRQRTREEQVFRQAFEGGLALQKERVRELRRVAREQEEASNKQHRDRLDAMENYYRDQLEMLSESMVEEKANLTLREKAQKKLVAGIRRELRGKMEGEIQKLHKTLDREADVTHFRQLDELSLRSKLANLSFTANIH